ncbi:MAG: hypothetical protein K2R98_09500 [Gemmataceae bacterium]|nr:hypothetical protein [Gemmataceae bacterium]
MWIFLPEGFFSVVCGRTKDGLDADTITVRARLKQHLENLIARFSAQLAGHPIKQTDDTDYRYRLILPKTTWVKVLALIGQELDYGNFKSRAATVQGKAGRDYVDALHDVWAMMRDLQS